MGFADFRARMLGGEVLAGTMVRTPAYELVEVLAGSGLDFLCFDAEHAPFDRGRLDACLAMARALDFPALVRVPSGAPENLLTVLDSGALGVVCPHVDSAEKARALARGARFGLGGRGFAGSTRWAGYTGRAMADVLVQSQAETVVIAQIEEPEGVEAAAEIAGVDGIDGLFIGPADLSVGYGKTDLTSDALKDAFKRVGEAARAAGKAYMTYVSTTEQVPDMRDQGITMFFVSSEQGLMRAGAQATAAAIKG